MKLIKTNKETVTEMKEVQGLISYRIEHEIKSAKGRVEYSGPMFTRQMWHQVLSFFRWTHKEMQSESQVRLYVNSKLGRWGAWSFPQQARTGMSAHELPIQETPEQACERFASWNSEPSDDWLYFGTAHHHCAASAFQSSTDERNEWNQDGLHITMGRMDADRHDLHARLYLCGHCFEPDLSAFWPIDPDLAARVPPGMLDEVARFEMCEKIVVDFPNTWRTNLVEQERRSLPREPVWNPSDTDAGFEFGMRLEDAMEEIFRGCSIRAIRDDQVIKTLQALSSNDANQVIIEACVKYGVTPDDLLADLSQFEFQY